MINMKDTLLKILRVIIWIIGFPIIILVLGIFIWFTSLIDFINE